MRAQVLFFSEKLAPAILWGRNGAQVNSEGFLAEVFHPWVRWEGPGSGFENSSGGGVWAQVGGPKLGPRGWAQAGPKWVGPRWAQAGPKLVKNLDFFKHHFLQVFEKLEPDTWGHFQNTIFLRVFETWDPDIFQKSEISKISCSSHSKNAHIKVNLDS